MSSYYEKVYGNLRPGDIAKSEDINEIQTHIEKALKTMLSDLHDGESYILGSGDSYRNAFYIRAAPKKLGRYIDTMNVFETNNQEFFNINYYDIKQPIPKTKTSVYSIITKMRNASKTPVTVQCDLEDEDGNILKSNFITLKENTPDGEEYEIVFDLPYYPTTIDIDYEDLIEEDGKSISINTDEASYETGPERHKNEDGNRKGESNGITVLYFVIRKTQLNEVDFSINGDENETFDPESSLGVYYTTHSDFAEQNIFASKRLSLSYEITPYNIFYKDVYSNGQTYLCKGGRAIIDGEKVICVDSHVEISGKSSYGNMLTNILMTQEGHLIPQNMQASGAKKPKDFKLDLDDRPPMASLLIAQILTYSNVEGTDKEPLIIQADDLQETRPRSHHERIRRLEKQMDWTQDKAMPPRIKYTLTDNDWIDESATEIAERPFKKDSNGEEKDLEKASFSTTFDGHGNMVAVLNEEVPTEIPITLKEKKEEKNSDGDVITVTDVLDNASLFSTNKNMTNDTTKGTLELAVNKANIEGNVGSTDAEAKETTFNPWDDSAENRPAKALSEIEPTERGYTVVSNKNGPKDFDSHYPGMTLYLDKNYTFTSIKIPITKFKDCESVTFYIHERQSTNDKENTVWFKRKVWTSQPFSLKNAKIKGEYQYMEEGFILNFEDKGLSLTKGQYVIIAIPKAKKDKGTLYVKTYKPENSKDFCIDYHGAANGSHYLLDTRYHEIWYDPSTATGFDEKYQKEGYVESKTVTFPDEESVQGFKSITPYTNENLTCSEKDGCSYTLYVDTGSGYQEVTPNKANPIGGSKTFKWKLVFKSNGKNTPSLAYNEKDNYAIKFVLTRSKASATDTSGVNTKNKTMALTSKTFDGNEILREYMGDYNLEDEFTQFEFARVWGDKIANQNLLIDIAGSDKTVKALWKQESLETSIPLWSLHYCDLTLDDFEQINVDYSNYTEDLEYDENNLRLKLDSEHAYNDNDISIFKQDLFKKETNAIDKTTEPTMILTSFDKETVGKNQRFMKARFDKPIDLTKYSALTFSFSVDGTRGNDNVIESAQGFAIYISSSYLGPDELPTHNNQITDEILTGVDVLEPEIDPEISSAEYYEGKILGIIHPVSDGNVAEEMTYYRYVKVYSPDLNKFIYRREQVHNITPYNLYEAPKITFYPDEEDKNKYVARVIINSDSNNLKYAREIGFITLNDEINDSEEEPKGYIVSDNPIKLTFEGVKAVSEDYCKIYNPTTDSNLIKSNTDSQGNNYIVSYKNGEMVFNETTYHTEAGNCPESGDTKHKTTNYPTTQICLYRDKIPVSEEKLFWINNEYGDLSQYSHIGIQLASDVYLPKDSLKLQLCSEKDGEGVFASVNLPTLNTIYYPRGAGSPDEDYSIINLSQIFKKIDANQNVKSIRLVSTEYTKPFVDELIDSTKPAINLFLGNITLYKARTIPFFHNKMRFKFYIRENGKIKHHESELKSTDLEIRKVGVIADYK